MNSRSGNLGSFVLLILLIASLIMIAQETSARDNDEDPGDGKVEIVYGAETTVPYKQRRGNWSLVWALNMDQVVPGKYRSQVNNDSYTDVFGEDPVKLIQLEAGVKFNFALGSLGASVLGGAGSVTKGGTGPGDKLSLTKKGLSLNFFMDNLFQEPYVVPYLQGQMYNFDWKETRDNSLENAGTTGFGMAMTFGALFQLNWLDPDTALKSMNAFGLQNTYLDLFVSQYNTSNSEEDPDFQTDMNYGAGIRLEF